MKVLRYTLGDWPKVVIPLGVAGEHLATRIEIDCTPWLAEYPDAVIALLVKQPDGNEYPALVTMEGNVAMWTLQSTDTSTPGYGWVEVRCNCPVGSQQLISISGRTHLYPSLNKTDGGDPAQPWIEDVVQAGVDAKASATAAQEAAMFAQQVATGNGFALMQIEADGHLYCTRTDNIVDELDFALNDAGELEVYANG